MAKRKACFGSLQLRGWATVGFGQLLFLLLLGPIFVVLLKPEQTSYDTSVTENNVQRARRSAASTDSQHSGLPPNILTTSHLSSLRDLVSDKKITVHFGLCVSFSGPRNLLDPQLHLFLNKQSGIYNTGEKLGLFSMRIVGIKKVSSTP